MSQLSAEAQELLARRARAAPAVTSGASRADRSHAKLSAAQQRIWLHDQLEAGAGYVRPAVLAISGPLDVPALERAVAAVVHRHELLRSRLVDGPDGLPALRILDEAPPRLAVDPTAERLLEEAHRPFDLRNEPPVRMRLFRDGPARHLLLAAFHHIAFDGWSLGVYFRDLEAAYAAARRDPARSSALLLTMPALQPGDLAEAAAGDAPSQRDVEYWRAAVRGVEPVLALPLDHPRRPGQSREAGRAPLALSNDLVQRLRELGRQEGVSLFTVVAAAVQVLLSRYTLQDDFLLGMPVAGRSRPESHDLIGCFISTLALRADLSGRPTFRDLLQRIRRRSAEALAHPTVPFEHVLRLLDAPGQTAAGIQVLLNFRNLPVVRPALEGLGVEQVPLAPPVTLFDLEVDVTETGPSLSGALVYPRASFDDASMERMAEQLVVLLESALADTAGDAAALSMLPETERRELLEVRAGTSKALPAAAGVHHLITEQAVATPDALAITGPAGDSTFADLLARAGGIAGALMEHGVARGDLVGLSVDRTPDLVAAMLGIMAAGAAYVPLDPEYPDDRISLMVDDARLRCIVVDGAAERRLARVGGASLLPLRAMAIAGPWAPVPTAADDPAYVIYTSGSTGVPKGVVVSHGALTAFSASTIDDYQLTAGDRFIQFSTPNFDASVVEIFPTLAVGGAVVLRDATMAASAEGYLEGCARWGVTHAVPPTAFWHEVVRALAEAGKTFPGSLRVMGPGGERMLPERAALWSRVAPGTQLRNAYGPTETTVHITEYVVPAGFGSDEGTVPIGRPNANSRAYVLDAAGRLAPVGTPGELHLGGPQVALGYLHRPELTAERFIPSPFTPGDRLYRTGDLVRWRTDGELEHLGRLDRQVKIRGFRVEIGEIESATLASGLVAECAVEARAASGGEQRLVAWVVPVTGGASPELPEALSLALRTRLPAWMLPAIVPLDAIPLTPNGKLDRAALPAPGAAAAHADAVPVPPRSPLEFQLVQVWERLLDVRPIGVRDDFFALGGHSLLAVRMAHELEQACGYRLPLGLLFEAATIEQLAAALMRAAAPAPNGRLVLNAGGTRPPLIFFHGDVLGAGLYCRAVARRLGPDQPVHVVSPSGCEGPATIEEMAARELPWLRRIAGGRYRLAGFCNGGLLAYELARQLEAAGERAELVFMIDTPPRNIGVGWLARLLDRGEPNTDSTLWQRAVALRRAADAGQRWRIFQRRPRGERVRVVARKAGELVRMIGAGAPPEARITGNADLEFTGRAVDAYVPESYGGPVTIVVSNRILGGAAEARRWALLAGSLTVHDTPLDHQAVVTECVPDLLHDALAALEP